MSLAGKLWDWLTSSEARGRQKGHPDLHPIDVDALTRELNLRVEAKRLGLAGLPSPSSKTLSGPEAMIVQRVEKARQDYVDWAARRLSILAQDAAKQNVEKVVNRARQADAEFERQASALIVDEESILRSLQQAEAGARLELEDFRAKNKLSRPATSPSSTERRTYVLIAFALVLIEGVVNAALFATGLSNGIIGGFVQAAGAAALNVFVAFNMGRFVPGNLIHTSLWRKMLGVALTCIAVSAMLGIGLAIAHYREALTAALDEPLNAASAHILEHPLDLHGMDWVLFALSVVFALVAFFEGFKMNDPYPGYGNVSDRHDRLAEEYEQAFDELRHQLEELKDQALKDLDADLAFCQAAVLSLDGYIADKETTSLRLHTALADANNSLEALLRTFRTENELHRANAARPEYFDTKPELEPIAMPDDGVSKDSMNSATQKAQLDLLQTEVQTLRANIQAAFNAQFDRLKPLELHFVSTEA